MPTFSCHFSDDEAPLVEKAIAESREKKEGPWVRHAVRTRLESDGYVPNTSKNDIRIEALATAEIVGEQKVLEALKRVKMEATAEKAANVG